MSKTIEELEGMAWSEPEYNSHVVTNAHRLRKKSIDEFTVEDLRFMIGQNIGTQHLMPKALSLLEENPLIEDYHYPGELLQSVLQIPEDYWSRYPDNLAKTIEIGNIAVRRLSEIWEERRAEAKRRYGAELDYEECREYPETEIFESTNSFLKKYSGL